MRNYQLRVMIEIAVMVALSWILGQLRFIKMPYGGSVSLEMMPIFVLAFRNGPVIGIIGGAIYGLLQLTVDPYILNPWQVIFDYPLPYALIGIAGFFGKHEVGIVIGSLARYVSHVIAGLLFWVSTFPEDMHPWLYSLLYNGSYMLPELILAVLVIHLLKSRREIIEPQRGRSV